MTTEIAKVSQFKTIGDELIVSMTGEIIEIQKELELKYNVSLIPEDLTDKDNYKLVQSAVRDIKNPRIALEKNRKEISAVPFNLCKKINAAAKPIMESLVSLETAWKAAKVEFDEKVEQEKLAIAKAEQDRLDAITAKIEEIKALPFGAMNKSSEEIAVILEGVKANYPEEWGSDYIVAAKDTVAMTIERLENLLSGKKAQEELERQQKAEAERLEAERIAAEKKADEERAEQARQNQIEADRLAKLQADIDRKQKEAEAEQKRMDAVTDRIKSIDSIPARNIGKSISFLRDLVVELKDSGFDWAGRYANEAQETTNKTIESLESIVAEKEAQEEAEHKVKTEADKLAAERAAMQKEKDEREEAAKAEAEAKAKAEREEQERKDAEARTLLALREREKADRENAELQEARVSETVAAMCDCVAILEEDAIEIINEIIAGNIPHVTFGA